MDNLSTVDKLAGPNVSFMKSFHCAQLKHICMHACLLKQVLCSQRCYRISRQDDVIIHFTEGTDPVVQVKPYMYVLPMYCITQSIEWQHSTKSEALESHNALILLSELCTNRTVNAINVCV